MNIATVCDSHRRSDRTGGRWSRMAARFIVTLLVVGNPTSSIAQEGDQEFGFGYLQATLPEFFFQFRVFDSPLWQWGGLLLNLVFAPLFGWIAAKVVIQVVHSFVHRTRTEFDDRLLALASGPLWLALAVIIFAIAEEQLGVAGGVQTGVDAMESVLLIVAGTWLALRVIDLVAEVLRDVALRRGRTAAVPLLKPGRNIGKAITVGVALITMLGTFGLNVSALVTGLGIGGIAVALAAQKSIENFFGGVMLFADQPVRVGDFCRFSDKIGTVEEIGLRSTQVRTLDRTVVSVPNGEFASLQLDNFSKRDKIWYHPRLGLRYETTPDQIRYILVELRKMLYAHPKVDPEPARIRFVNFGAFSLDLDIFAYVQVTDYGEFLEVAEDLNLRIMDIVERAGSGFAFPSQTTYLEQGTGLNAEVARKAEQQVREWRERDTLYIPGFPREKIHELHNTLDYPPQGSPMAAQRRA